MTAVKEIKEMSQFVESVIKMHIIYKLNNRIFTWKLWVSDAVTTQINLQAWSADKCKDQMKSN